MKKIFTLFSLVTVMAANAQTITYSNFSAALTQTANVAIANLASFNLALTTTTGNPVTWNATGLTQQSGTPIIHLIYGNPASTPNGSQFPGSNYVQYDPALTALLSYTYKNFGPDSVVKTGGWDPSNAHEIYQNYDKQLIFPFSYGQSFTDTYAKTNYSNATTISSYQTGSRTVIFSGYGTLALPQATFSNVALVSELRTNSLGPNSTTFTWYDMSNGKQLMLYSENNGNANAAYTTDINTGVKEYASNVHINIYPNPFSEYAAIKIESELLYKQAALKVTDVCGKEIHNSVLVNGEAQINRNGIDAGIYIYSLLLDNQIVKTGKLIIE